MLHFIHEATHVSWNGEHAQSIETTVEHVSLDADFIERFGEGAYSFVWVLTCQKVDLLESTTIGFYATKAAKDKANASGMTPEEAAALKHAKADAIVAQESGIVLWEIGGDAENVKAIEPFIGKEYNEGDFFCYIENSFGKILDIPAALGGRLVEINAKQGSHVQKGDVIAYIERSNRA